MMRRGEVWIARLSPNKGAEIGKQRPVVVLQDDALLASALGTVVVLPLTTQYRPAFAPLRVHVAARGRLLKDCYAIIEQPRAIDRRRFGDGPLAVLTGEEMAAVEKGLGVLLGFH